jgi:hypothetical protein
LNFSISRHGAIGSDKTKIIPANPSTSRFVWAESGKEEKSPLAIRADPKKFQLVGHSFETVCSGNARFDFARKTFINFNHFRAARADQMMVMPVIAFADKLESRRAVAKVKPLHHAHFLKQVHGAINGRQIALAFGYGSENFPVRQRMGVSAQNFQDRLTWAGDFAQFPAQTTRQRGQFLPLVRMGTGAGFHYHPKITLAIPKDKSKCKSLATRSSKKSRPTVNAIGRRKTGYFISNIWRARLMARVNWR